MDGEAGRLRPGPRPPTAPDGAGGGAATPRAARVAAARWAVSAGAALLVLGPGLAPGYVLLRDMVFTPSPPISARLLGIGHETPRAVPSDLVVALASHVLPGDLVQKLVLLAVLVSAGVGAARLAPPTAVAGSAAALAAIWNPFVAERLAMGQWAVLVGYAALPWVVLGVARAGSGGRGGLPLVLGLAVAALGGASSWLIVALGALAAALGLAVARRRRGLVLRRLLWWAAFGLVVTLPWSVPALLRPHGLTSDPAGFEVFAPSADTPLGLVASILTGGASWNADVVPPGRDTALGVAGALALLAWSMAGFLLARRGPVRERHAAAAAYLPALVAVGLAGLLVPAVSLLRLGAHSMASLPGGGLFRDASRELGLWALVVAVGAGWAVAWLSRTSLPALAGALVGLLPAAVLPSAGWGLAGVLHPIGYPDDLMEATAMLHAEPGAGAVVVLPFETVRRYPWNGGRPSQTPWSRLLDRRVAVSSDLVVSTPTGLRTVAGEDAYAAAVDKALAAPDAIAELNRLGVGWVVVDGPGAVPPQGADPVLEGTTTTLYRVGPSAAVDAAAPREFDPPAGPVLVGDILALGWMVGGAVLEARRRRAS